MSKRNKIFYPKVWADSAYGLPYEHMVEKGIQGLIFDVDNTLALHDAPADERAVALFAYLRQLGLKTCLLSNNKEPRVKAFAQAVGAHYVFKGGKPGVRGYQESMERMGTDRRHTVAVGDQLFTDILGANRAGIYSILVTPIDPREEIQIVLKRYLERPVLWAYKKSHPGEPIATVQREGERWQR
ncbi:MAG: YqeG family HAD IIIA-type phosphatase [Lachnospiraceae bacterium]|nr:YqeG family HAD IIIA-type phosphatase [Lachnospiraceae bacterium]